jgi:hypothetical protein
MRPPDRGRSCGRILLALCCAGALLPKSAFAQDAVAEFYRGRQVNLIIGYGPRGGYDTAARLLARHLGRYPPGNPSIVAQNMPGVGSMRSLLGGAARRRHLRPFRKRHCAHRAHRK